MVDIIILAMRNFTLTFFIFSLLFALLEWLIRAKPLGKAKVIEIIFSWFLLFNIGLAYLFNFVMHVSLVILQHSLLAGHKALFKWRLDLQVWELL